MADKRFPVARVISAAPFPKTQSLAVNIENHEGTASLVIGPDALVELGAVCLHAATNAPLGHDAAIPVLAIKHQAQPNGWQTIGFQVLGTLEFFLTVEPEGAAALRDMLTTAIGPSPDLAPSPGPLQ